MRHYNKGTERCPLIDYNAFVNGLRVQLDGPRAECVKDAFQRITGDSDASSFTIAQARAAFSYDEFEKWCDAIGCSSSDETSVSWEQFRDFYADISMTIFNDREFISLVSDSW